MLAQWYINKCSNNGIHQELVIGSETLGKRKAGSSFYLEEDQITDEVVDMSFSDCNKT